MIALVLAITIAIGNFAWDHAFVMANLVWDHVFHIARLLGLS